MQSSSTLEMAGADGYSHLKKLIMLLKMGKPPATIPADQLFKAITDKVEQMLQGKVASDYIRRALIDVPLSPMQCDKMDNLAKGETCFVQN